MTARSIDWQHDLPLLRAFVDKYQPYRRLFATLSGADLYGFPSIDGDYDIRGAHVLPMRHVVTAALDTGGADTLRGMTVEVLDKSSAPEMDFVSHDVGKFLRLALKGNGYVLEQLHSPLIIETNESHRELQNLGARLITRRVYYHYRGFFANQEKLYDRDGSKRIKGLLYRYRVALTGIHALESGRIEANLLALNDWYRSERITELIALKTAGEHATLTDDAPYVAEIDALQPRLDAAHASSALPDDIPQQVRAACEDFLWRCRSARTG